MSLRRLAQSALAAGLAIAACLASAADPQVLYREHCATCHGAERLGGTGPALLPESLSRLKRTEAEKVVAEGRLATQMPGFAGKLDAAAIQALAAYIYGPPAVPVAWTESDIRASRLQLAEPANLPDRPSFEADPLNLFVVVESGDHHVSILDGDKLEPMARFPSRFALHGGPKFSPDGRFVYFASRDGWITKYDLWNLTKVAEVRAGINTRNAAVSGDGKFVAVANYLPHTLVILDRDLNLVKVIPVADKDGKQSSRVSAVYDAAPRRSFVAALKDVKEVWEVSYDPSAPEIPVGMIHDFRYREGTFVPGFLNPRRSFPDDFLDDFFFTQDYSQLIGASREGARGQVVQLDVRRKIADVPLPGMPHLGSGITWERAGRPVLASPNLKEGVVTVLDIRTWKPIKEIQTLGPGFFMRSHENSRYAWVDAMMSPEHKDTLQVIDKESLEIAAQVRPEPGKTVAHIEFDRYGKYALASLWEDDGALIVFDASTLKEVKRIPMRKPVGKYNVYNKITRSSGTSH